MKLTEADSGYESLLSWKMERKSALKEVKTAILSIILAVTKAMEVVTKAIGRTVFEDCPCIQYREQASI